VDRRATVISPERPDSGQVLHVLIDGDRIEAVTPIVPADMAGVAVVHAEGRYLIPGLMDSHVHLTGIPAIPYPMRAQHPDLVEAYLRQVPRSFLRYGYTTVVDLIVTDPRPLQTMRAARPDIYDRGGALRVPNGYPSENAPAEYRFQIFPNPGRSCPHGKLSGKRGSDNAYTTCGGAIAISSSAIWKRIGSNPRSYLFEKILALSQSLI